MEGATRSFARPDTSTKFPNGHQNIVEVAGEPVGLATFEPGWRWSNDVRPLIGTDRCPVHHVGYTLSGRLHIEFAGGGTLDLAPGDVFDIPGGHDAWVVGEEPWVALDWGGQVREYAKPQQAQAEPAGDAR
jgi:hypothetical protein